MALASASSSPAPTGNDLKRARDERGDEIDGKAAASCSIPKRALLAAAAGGPAVPFAEARASVADCIEAYNERYAKDAAAKDEILARSAVVVAAVRAAESEREIAALLSVYLPVGDFSLSDSFVNGSEILRVLASCFGWGSPSLRLPALVQDITRNRWAKADTYLPLGTVPLVDGLRLLDPLSRTACVRFNNTAGDAVKARIVMQHPGLDTIVFTGYFRGQNDAAVWEDLRRHLRTMGRPPRIVVSDSLTIGSLLGPLDKLNGGPCEFVNFVDGDETVTLE